MTRVIYQAAMRPHVLNLPAFSLAARFRPLAAKVLAWAGVDAGDSSRARARAIVGWIAAHAVHPSSILHPDGTSLNTSVLPSGETWASFNALFNTQSTIDRDQAYWYSLFPDGETMLERLIGTVASDGTITDNGMLTEYAPNQWQIRNFANFRAPQCTLQCKMAQVLLAAVGIPGVDISTAGHDPMAYYDIEEGRWLYIDPTFGEMLLYAGDYANPLDLLMANLNGYAPMITGEQLPGASYIAVGYYNSPNYPVGGMSFMTIHTAPQWAGGLSARAPYGFGDLPSQSSVQDASGTVDLLMPTLGVGIAGLKQIGQNAEVRLRSNWFGHVSFQRSMDDGATWAVCGETDYLEVDSGTALYRSTDVDGFAGSLAVVDT